MHRIIIMSLILLPFSTRAQYSDTARIHDQESRLHRSGLEFIKYQKQIGIATTFEIIGAAAIVGGTVSDAQANKGIIGIGIGVTFIGYIIERVAVAHIGRAGFILRGNSIILLFGKR
jgi:hypothetical protein